jgi:CheY-like chemotaxis protein
MAERLLESRLTVLPAAADEAARCVGGPGDPTETILLRFEDVTELRRGSEFVARLPANAGVRAEVGPAVSGGARRPGGALRLLLVDDNGDSRESMALLLRLWGHRVETAPDGRSALAAARAALPEVVLLDISLPGMDGHEVCRRLRREPGLERAFLVAVTGHAHEDDHRRSREAGFDLHLDKPVDLDVLEQLLADHGAVAPPGRA